MGKTLNIILFFVAGVFLLNLLGASFWALFGFLSFSFLFGFLIYSLDKRFGFF
jgi:hypothetical protein